ncbi:MAG TPA: choice-of-anchor D domain-containing protein [Acidobacteriaceae bacterium]|nr:choice-of-anchor D domain-containing protein [Acidobacteriaceae bacterium]
MNFGKVEIAFVTATVLGLACNLAIAQSTASANQGTNIYVNGSTGSDSHPGTSSQPFKTIQAGVDKAISDSRSGIATTVDIAPGVYREQVNIEGKTSAASMTVRAQTPGTVSIDGSDVLTNWHLLSGTVYEFPWTDSVSGCPLPGGWPGGMPPIALKNEMVMVNGNSLTQVMSASQLSPGTFYLNGAYQIEVDPPSGTDMSTAQVEATARRETLVINNTKNLYIYGINLQHAASCMNTSGANVFSSSNVTLDSVQANWNNWGGLDVSSSSYITLKNSTLSYNGGVGFTGYQNQHVLSSNNEADYNNWRGEMNAFYDYAQGGFKFLNNRYITVNGQKSYNNQAEGLWFDTDNENVTVESSTLVNNAADNLKLEANEGPFTISSNISCTGGVGVLLMDSQGVTLTNNYFYGNQNSVGNLEYDQNGQIFLAGNPGGRRYNNFLTGAAVTSENKNIKLSGNSFANMAAGQYLFNTYLSGYEWSDFLGSFQSESNKWSNGPVTQPFRIPGGKTTTLSGWRGLTGQDGTSVSEAISKASACTVPVPAHPDFALLAYNDVNYVSSRVMSGGKLTIPLQIKSFSYGTVTLSASGLPSGVGASFSPSSLASGNSTLTLSASRSAASQTVPITVFARSGSRVHTITFWVAVRPGTTTTAQAAISPNSLLWGKVALGNAGGQKTIKLTNDSTRALNINSIGLAGTDPRDFFVYKKTCGSSLAAWASCTATILFKPTTSGTRTAVVSFNDGAGSQGVSLTGLGVKA